MVSKFMINIFGTLLHSLDVLLLSIFPKISSFYHREMCSKIFTVVRFLMARKWKEP